MCITVTFWQSLSHCTHSCHKRYWTANNSKEFRTIKQANRHRLHWERKTKTNEKALRETQTLRTGCSKAEPKIFAPPQTPFLGVRDGQNLISWRWSLHLPKGEDRCMQFWVIVVTVPQTHTHTNQQTHRQDWLQYIAPLSLVCSVKTIIYTINWVSTFTKCSVSYL